MEIPSTHTVPLSWLYEAASLPIQYRTLTEVVPEPARDFERLASLREEMLHYKEALAIVRKQKDTGLWGANLLAPAPSKAWPRPAMPRLSISQMTNPRWAYTWSRSAPVQELRTDCAPGPP